MMIPLADWLLPVTVFAVAMSATPGPNNVMVAASGATFGFRPTVPHILGISVGFPVMVGIIALGASEPLRTWPWLQQGLRWVGAAYLLWLAWHIARADPAAAEAEGQARAARRGRPITFVQAALFQWVNPKAWVIAAGAVVTYVDGSGTTFFVRAAGLVAIFLVTTAICVGMWAGVGAGAAKVLRTARAVRRFNMVMAGLLVLSLIPMFFE
jgi:threonine/homoserine/homoserine lactone efflux protein